MKQSIYSRDMIQFLPDLDWARSNETAQRKDVRSFYGQPLSFTSNVLRALIKVEHENMYDMLEEMNVELRVAVGSMAVQPPLPGFDAEWEEATEMEKVRRTERSLRLVGMVRDQGYFPPRYSTIPS